MTTKQNLFTFDIIVKHYERAPLDGGGFTTHRLPDTEETVTVEVNFLELAQLLGPRAVRSRGGKSLDAKGAVVVRHVRA